MPNVLYLSDNTVRKVGFFPYLLIQGNPLDSFGSIVYFPEFQNKVYLKEMKF